MKINLSQWKTIIILGVVGIIIYYALNIIRENFLLKKVIERLTADSRVAEVIVTNVQPDPETRQVYTTIKFLEYDAQGKGLEPKYFTFSGNIIQFQAMVVRFDDFYIKKGHPLKGKSAKFFLKAFRLTDQGAEIFEITKTNEVPGGYAVAGATTAFEKRLWERFWKYALEPKEARRIGIKNAQIEAPGTKFIPGLMYTLKIEHDGGLRIDSQSIAEILRNEKVEF